ncbi:DUF488 family protein [Streptomyces camelliae]|uniref:DUF488 family protein n=1 Tax=Streptomyces camelliae TaxID=3004093 RepID=UPI002FD81FBF
MSVRARRIHGEPEPDDACGCWSTGYEEFRSRYEAEPDAPEAAELVDGLCWAARRRCVALPTASRTPEQSHAQVVPDLLRGLRQPVCRAACWPAARPENRQPPRNVPSSAL